LLVGGAVLTLSSRFRGEVATLMPAPQLAAAVIETPMARADVADPGVPVPAPPARANMQQRTRAAETPAPTRSASARPGRDSARAADRTARLEPSSEQERKIARSAKMQADAAPTPPSDSATLLLAVRPWGEVYVDGQKIGVTPPLKRFQVAPGRRLVTIKNSSLPEYSVRLSVDPEAEVTIAHDFSCTSDRERRCWDEISKGLAPQSRSRFNTVAAESQTELR